MSLRSLIEAKQRRTAKWPLLVGDLSAAATEVGLLRAALDVELRKRGPEKPTKAQQTREARLRKQLAEAQEKQAACVVEIELQAIPDDQWEALFAPLEADEHGDLDLASIHAPLLAASCTDPDLQDEAWWAEQLKGPQWSKGDRASLSRVLLELNTFAPTGVPGKD